jgi:AraC family transcriptional regulator
MLCDRGTTPLRCTDLALEAGVHPVHLARVFRARHGISPGEYLRRRRLDWAAHRLAESAVPIADIALEAGFADQSHLTRSFHRWMGLTPLQYRRCRGGAASRGPGIS